MIRMRFASRTRTQSTRLGGIASLDGECLAATRFGQHQFDDRLWPSISGLLSPGAGSNSRSSRSASGRGLGVEAVVDGVDAVGGCSATEPFGWGARLAA